MPDFDRRDTDPEMMDDLSITGRALTQALDELRVVDGWLGGSRTSVQALAPVLARQQAARVLDVGCGGGDFLATLARWSARTGTPVEVAGVDYNAETVAYARQHLDATLPPAARARVTVRQADALALPFADGAFDVAHAGLFLHHFDDAQAARVLREMRRVARVVVLNDLHRHPVAYYAIAALATLFQTSAMFRADAPHSVLRGFRRDELARVVEAAGLGGTIAWRWAFRWIAVLS